MIGSLLKAFGRRHLQLHLAGPAGTRVEIYERPGLWMAPERLSALAADLRQVASTVLAGEGLDYGAFRGGAEAFAPLVITLVRDASGAPLAFNAMAFMEIEMQPAPVEVLHLGLVMVDPRARAQSLTWVLYGLTCILLFLRGGLRPLWVSNVTQVPAVVGMVSEMFSDVWPMPAPPEQQAERSLLHLALARRIMTTHRAVFGVGSDAGFDEARFVITNAYTGGSDHLKKTLAQAAPHRDPAVGQFCAAMLDYARGDDLLQLGRLDLPVLRRYITRQVPRGALGTVVVGGGFALLSSIIGPLLQWRDSSRPWSILRPSR